MTKVNREGKLNLLALVPPSDEMFSEPPAEKTPAEAKQMMPVDIAILKIDQDILEFRDGFKAKPFSWTLCRSRFPC